MEPIFLEPAFKDYLWGGTALRDIYKNAPKKGPVAEAWIVSAHPHGPSIVSTGQFKGKTLDELWELHPEFFSEKKLVKFPILIKILDAQKDLAVQVHPKDDYAKKYENDLGKTECWYILKAKPNARIIYGHRAQNKDEFKEMVEKQEWDALFKEVPVKKGDFVYLPAGSVHALGEGITAIEIQESSDVTYRIYDFDRVDQNGNKRSLHLEKSYEVTDYPSKEEPILRKNELPYQNLVKSPFFQVDLYQIKKSYEIVTDEFLTCTIIEGNGTLSVENQEYSVTLGQSFFLPRGKKALKINGNCKVVATKLASL